MTGKVIPFTGITRLDLDPDDILDQSKGKLEGVVILGFLEDGSNTYFASSYADGGTVLWLLEKLKLHLLSVE
jgi:hypothetical protein